jgi:hypothetical protein
MQKPNILVIFAMPIAAAVISACSAIVGDSEFVPPARQPLDTMHFTDTGVPGLDPSTAFSTKAIQAAMPGYQVSAVTMATESSESVSALAVFKDGLQVLQIVPGAGGHIAAIHGVSERITGPNGERIGMSFREARLSRSDCREGSGNWLGMAICRAKSTPTVSFVFSVPGYISVDGLPDDSILATATLQRMIWTPKVG